jgi:hypothetical protein
VSIPIDGGAFIESNAALMPRLPLSKLLLDAGALLLVAGSASAIELRDAELLSGGRPVLQNVSGSVRLVDARLGRTAPPVLFVPEPAASLQLGVGAGLLSLLADRRRQRAR